MNDKICPKCERPIRHDHNSFCEVCLNKNNGGGGDGGGGGPGISPPTSTPNPEPNGIAVPPA